MSDEPFREPELVGSDRRDLVSTLVGVFDTVAATKHPHLIFMEAAGGWGKTRIVRELYRGLAARQPAPAYWPADLLHPSFSGPGEAIAARKTISASFDRQPESLPSYLWWGIACGVELGLPISRLGASLTQLQAHAPYLEAAWLRRATRRQRTAKAYRGFLGSIGIESGMEASSGMLEAAAGGDLYGLGLAWWLLQRTAGAVSEKAATRRIVGQSQQIGTDSLSLAAECAAVINRLADCGIPTVIVVEDAHLIDEAHSELLATLMTGESPILVVLTAKPHGSDSNLWLERVLVAREDRVTSYTDEKSDASALARDRTMLGTLDPADRRRLIEMLFASVESTTAGSIANRYDLPLQLLLISSLPKLRRQRPGEVLSLSQDEIAAMPSSIASLYRQLWEELPEGDRRAIKIALESSAGSVAPQLDLWRIWDPQRTKAAIVGAGLHDAAALSTALDAPHRSWVQNISANMHRIVDDDTTATVERDDDLVAANELAAVRRELAVQLESEFPAEVSLEETVPLWPAAQLSVALAAAGEPVSTAALGMGGFVLSHAFMIEPTAIDMSIDISRILLARLIDDDVEQTINFRRALARALLEAGRIDEALDEFDILIDQISGLTGAESTEVAIIHCDRSTAFWDLGRGREALAELDAALPRLQADEEVDSEQLWIIEHTRAVYLTDLGRAEEAKRELVTLLGKIRGAGKVDHLVELHCMSSLAAANLELGAPEALGQLRAVSSAADRILGPDSPTSLRMRNNVAVVLGTGGRPGEAVKLLETITETKIRVLGPTHPSTMVSRGNLANGYYDLNQLARATGLLRTLHDDYRRLLGDDHPGTITTRHNLASAVLDGGDHDEAIRLVEPVLAALVSTRGPAHTMTVRSRDILLEARRRQRQAGAEASAAFRRPR